MASMQKYIYLKILIQLIVIMTICPSPGIQFLPQHLSSTLANMSFRHHHILAHSPPVAPYHSQPGVRGPVGLTVPVPLLYSSLREMCEFHTLAVLCPTSLPLHRLCPLPGMPSSSLFSEKFQLPSPSKPPVFP